MPQQGNKVYNSHFYPPTRYCGVEHLQPVQGNGVLENVIGSPLETTIALSHLIFEGTLDAYPGLRSALRMPGDICPPMPPARIKAA
jgi:hypothetical protein